LSWGFYLQGGDDLPDAIHLKSEVHGPGHRVVSRNRAGQGDHSVRGIHIDFERRKAGVLHQFGLDGGGDARIGRGIGDGGAGLIGFLADHAPGARHLILYLIRIERLPDIGGGLLHAVPGARNDILRVVCRQICMEGKAKDEANE
jgi:hypothetical protein